MQKRFTYTRIHADEHGESHFQRVEVELGSQGAIGWLSAKFPVSTMEFRMNAPDHDWDYHTAPARQFIILLDGEIEITTSLGEKKRFGTGDVLLVEDTTGKGHRTRNVEAVERRSIFIQI